MIRHTLRFLLSSVVVVHVLVGAALSADGTFRSPFLAGPYATRELLISQAPALNFTSKTLPPKPLLLVIPLHAEDYPFPVVVFQHDYVLQNSFYTGILHHLASWGFICVAPQMYDADWGLPLAADDPEEEITAACELMNWIPAGLSTVIPPEAEVRSDLSRVAIIGHGRGGKVAFAVAVRWSATNGSLTPGLVLQAVVGLAPVDGYPVLFSDAGVQTQPRVLDFKNHSLNINLPSMVLGTGLGTRSWGVLPPCSPQNIGEQAFFLECPAPAYRVVAPAHGHMDFLNSDAGNVATMLCMEGPSRTLLRNLTGGLLVSFLRSYCYGEPAFELEYILETSSLAPINFFYEKFVNRESVDPIVHSNMQAEMRVRNT